MICTSCRKAEAVVFIKTIVNNKVSQQALCASCAGEAVPAGADSLLELLSGLLPSRPRVHPSRCPDCQTSYAQFRERGRFGCPACYEHFAAQIRSILPRIHAGATQHRGKAPKQR